MVEHCLYGVKVFCDLPLFDRPVLMSAGAPGEHAALELLLLDDGGVRRECTESTSLYNTHGREVLLHTDRELASSVPGQPWCLEVEGVVSFTWTLSMLPQWRWMNSQSCLSLPPPAANPPWGTTFSSRATPCCQMTRWRPSCVKGSSTRSHRTRTIGPSGSSRYWATRWSPLRSEPGLFTRFMCLSGRR